MAKCIICGYLDKLIHKDQWICPICIKEMNREKQGIHDGKTQISKKKIYRLLGEHN